MHHYFGKWYVTERRRKRRKRHLDLRVGPNRYRDSTRALRKMTLLLWVKVKNPKAPRFWPRLGARHVRFTVGKRGK
jgi:hypothetical protein